MDDRSPDRRSVVAGIFAEAVRAHERFMMLDPSSVVAAADAILDAVTRDRKVLVFGNGGSAADAQHLSAELVGRFARERRALAAIALSTDTSVITSIANDYGYDRVFARQVEGLGQAGDVAIAISTSGESPNVVAGLAAAREQGLMTVALTGGDGGAAAKLVDILIHVPEQPAARVQEVHRTVIHVLCELVERAVTGEPGAAVEDAKRA